MAALSETRHGRAVGRHVAVTQELTTLCASEGKVTGVTPVQLVVIDAPCKLEDRGFLFRVKTGIFGEEVAIEAGR